MFRAIIDTPKTRESLNSSLKTRKTIELLTGIAKTEDDKPKTIEKNENGEFEINTDTKEEQK